MIQIPVMLSDAIVNVWLLRHGMVLSAMTTGLMLFRNYSVDVCHFSRGNVDYFIIKLFVILRNFIGIKVFHCIYLAQWNS